MHNTLGGMPPFLIILSFIFINDFAAVSIYNGSYMWTQKSTQSILYELFFVSLLIPSMQTAPKVLSIFLIHYQ
jgi:hypothetical protein